MPEPLELRYTMTPDLQLQAAYGWSVPEAGTRLTGILIFQITLWLLLFFALVAVFQGGPHRSSGMLIVSGVGGFMLFSGISCIIMNARIKRLYADSLQGTGEVTFRLTADAISLMEDGSTTRMERRFIDDVIALRKATGLRIGAGTTPIPDSALPQDMTPEAFRETLRDWLAEGSR